MPYPCGGVGGQGEPASGEDGICMELRAGYKQTEAGVIPEEWDLSALGELISEMRGGAPLRPSDFKDSGVKVLPKGGVGRTGWLQVQDSEMQFCSPQYARAHRRNQGNL